MATKDKFYLRYAETKYEEFKFSTRNLDEFSWADKTSGTKVIIMKLYYQSTLIIKIY